jgi:hypothetical protein
VQTFQPELEIKKAHDVRKLQPCKCGGLGMKPAMIKVRGDWWHGRCAIEKFGIDAIAAMPAKDYAGLRWSEIGDAAMKRLLQKS